MVVKIKKAVTVLKKLGDGHSEITIHYDKNMKIKSLKTRIYNAFGVEIKKISKKDFKDYAAADGISLFNDGRLKFYDYVTTSYPYTIVYEYEIESGNTAFINGWYPFDSYSQSIQKSTYALTFPSDFKVKSLEKKFKEFNIKRNVNNTSFSFELHNSPAIKYEEYCPSYLEIIPSVMMASNKFHLEGYDGKANDWKEFGKWMYDNLIASRMELPESTKLNIKNLAKGVVDDPLKKAKIVYDFVQKKTRYISVQVGIGGWMPMLASDVDKLGYGDCKALTNYTKALLDEVDVTSYYTAVYGGREARSMEKDIVSVHGNHAFLYVPTKEKDYWLECTSQTVPFGYQGTFTDDRDVLVIKPEGGEIKHTNILSDKNSFQKTKANYTISNDGSITAQVEIKSAGIQYDQHYDLEKKSERDIKKHYKSNYWPYINNLTIDKHSFANDKDSFEIRLPENYTIEALGDDVTIENKFGTYLFSVEKISDKKLKYSRTFLLKKGTYPKEDYAAFRNFRKKIAKHDKTKIVLIKK